MLMPVSSPSHSRLMRAGESRPAWTVSMVARHVTRPRARIIAAQAVVVSVLLVIVYLTILRPDDDNMLSGVDAPPGVGPSVGGGDGNGGNGSPGGNGPGTNGGGGGARPGRGRRGWRGRRPRDAQGPGSAGVGPPSVIPGPPPDVEPDDDGDSPSDDQYSDAVDPADLRHERESLSRPQPGSRRRPASRSRLNSACVDRVPAARSRGRGDEG